MKFDTPLLLALIPVFFVLIAVPFVRRVRSFQMRALCIALLRLLVLALTVAGLAGPYTSTTVPSSALTAFVDVSASVTEGQGDELLAKARGLARELSVPLAVLPFSRDVIAAPVEISARATFSSLRSEWQKLDTGATDLTHVFSASAPRIGQCALLLSDGYENVHSIREYASNSPSVPIFPLTALGEESETALAISQLAAPLTALAQKSVDIKLTVSNLRQKNSVPASLEVRHGDKVVLSKALVAPAAQDLSFTAQSDPAIEGINPIRATLSWKDESGPHSVTKTVWLSGEKRDKVLLLSGSADDDRYLSRILTNQAYQLRSFVSPVNQASIGALKDYRVVVVNNLHQSRIPQDVLSGLRGYLRAGGGLVVVGGNTSYGLGGYIGSELEELLPVRLVPPHQEKKRLNLAVQLVVDKSRSMATDNRLEFAKAAAEEVVRNLKDEDYLGVIGFDEVPFIALPLSRLSSVRTTAISRISRLFPTSRTNLFPALDEARRGLSGVPAGRKHIIVLTDGKLPDPGPYYFDLIRQMRFLGVTLSTVLVGAEADDGFLGQLAQAGGGAFYQTADPQNLPRVFLSDIKVATGERTLKEDPRLTVRNGPDPIVSTSLRSFPILRGFVETKEREAAETELVVRNDEGTYPLLASWQVGKGRSIAFTSDANGRWSSDWLRWERIQEFWSEVLESAQVREGAKRHSTTQFDLRSWVEGSDVVVDLALFEDIAGKPVRATIETPRGESKRIDFSAIKPGNYQARIPNASAGTYKANVLVGADALPTVAWDLAGDLFGERPHRKPDVATLSEIARRSGGTVDPSSDTLRAYMRQESERRGYTHELLVVALLIFFLEALIRLFFASRAGKRVRA